MSNVVQLYPDAPTDHAPQAAPSTNILLLGQKRHGKTSLLQQLIQCGILWTPDRSEDNASLGPAAKFSKSLVGAATGTTNAVVRYQFAGQPDLYAIDVPGEVVETRRRQPDGTIQTKRFEDSDDLFRELSRYLQNNYLAGVVLFATPPGKSTDVLHETNDPLAKWYPLLSQLINDDGIRTLGTTGSFAVSVVFNRLDQLDLTPAKQDKFRELQRKCFPELTPWGVQLQADTAASVRSLSDAWAAELSFVCELRDAQESAMLRERAVYLPTVCSADSAQVSAHNYHRNHFALPVLHVVRYALTNPPMSRRARVVPRTTLEASAGLEPIAIAPTRPAGLILAAFALIGALAGGMLWWVTQS